MRARLVGITVVTVSEGPAVYLWLRLHEDGHELWAFLALAVGEVLETVMGGLLVARRQRAASGAAAGPSPARSRMGRLLGAASVGEIGIWLLWLAAADEIGQPIAAMFLLIAMHLKHHVEIVAVRAVPIGTDLFSVRGTFASAMETAGAVACLALILDGEPVLAAVALVIGFLVEHTLLVDQLITEIDKQSSVAAGRGRS